jgi:hypothetical protein
MTVGRNFLSSDERTENQVPSLLKLGCIAIVGDLGFVETSHHVEGGILERVCSTSACRDRSGELSSPGLDGEDFNSTTYKGTRRFRIGRARDGNRERSRNAVLAIILDGRAVGVGGDSVFQND